MIKGLQLQINRALNPTPTASQVLDILAVSDESFATVDANTITPDSTAYSWGPAGHGSWSEALWS